jgi:hypothetical protein
MSALGVLRCIECGAACTGRAAGWRAYLTAAAEIADEEATATAEAAAEAVVFCPSCSVREFDCL